MKVLIAHHVEECWDFGLRQSGTSFDEVFSNILSYIKKHPPDLFILTRFEAWDLGKEHWPLQWVDFDVIVEEYSYGWCEDMIDRTKIGIDWFPGGAHSEFVLVPEWLKNLRGNQVELCGCFDGECIEDMEIALDAASVKFNRLNHLIV